eukprot:5352136-Amphidinium_carterae.1
MLAASFLICACNIERREWWAINNQFPNDVVIKLRECDASTFRQCFASVSYAKTIITKQKRWNARRSNDYVYV